MTATIFSNVNAVDIFVKNKNILVTENWKKNRERPGWLHKGPSRGPAGHRAIPFRRF